MKRAGIFCAAPVVALLMVATAFAASNKKDAELGCESEEVDVCTGHDNPSADGAYGTADCEGFSFTLSNVVNAVEHSKRVRCWSGEGECQEDEDLGTASEEIVPNVSWSATLADGETSSGEGASAFVARGDNMSASCTFTLSAVMTLCGETLEASYSTVAALDFAISVGCEPDIVGQDRTGDPESEYEGPSVVAEANIEPDLPCIEGVEWFCTCDEGRSVETDWSYTLTITNREAASESWMDKEAKASVKGKSASARFTILKLDVEIHGLGEKDEHETGVFLKHVQDANDHGLMSEDGTNAMVSVKFTCWPEVVPDDVEVEVENSGPGELYEKLLDDTLVLVTKTNYPASGISEREFYLHGHEKSTSLKDGAITIQIESIKPKDEAYYTSVCLENISVSCDSMPQAGSFGNNPEIFPGECADFGHPDLNPPFWWLPGTFQNPSSRVFKLFYKYVKNQLSEYRVKFAPVIEPNVIGMSEIESAWYVTQGPCFFEFEQSATNLDTMCNIQEPGLYKINYHASVHGCDLEGYAMVLLPKAGGEISGWLVEEVSNVCLRATNWEEQVRQVAIDRGIDEDEFLETAWKRIATCDFDYQGVVGNPTKRYSFVDADRPTNHVPDPSIPGMAGEKGNGDWDEPSFATLCGVVVGRPKINNVLYCVWGRSLGYSTMSLSIGAYYNAISRDMWDDCTSQSAISLGGDLYDCYESGLSQMSLMTKERALSLQTPDNQSGSNDVNLWPDVEVPSHGFAFPDMPTEYELLAEGTNILNNTRGRLFRE